MKEDQYKTMLIKSWQKEEELYEFCIKCLDEIFKEDSDFAKHEFENMVENWEDYGCFQNLDYIKTMMNERKHSIETIKQIDKQTV